ncbi:MAG: glutathione S-transferase [Robiginitomaculum sp.]|nr:MAG: glutathione S-transferase [Robiginitomaculum sp.]PHQ68179.1 MAG: glutathione S-transferase [Robiginitomaculum sp.]
MRTLHHWPLDPDSRQARLALAEKKLTFKLIPVVPWAPSESFLNVCVEGVPPCLVEDTDGGKSVISTARAICEYVADDGSGRMPLLPHSAQERAEARRLCHWFDVKFASDVNAYILTERLEKSLSGTGAPDPSELRIGRGHLKFHLEYMEWLLESRDWLACNQMSLADLAAGAHISCLDYLGEIKWSQWGTLKEWYQKLKSRPSFRPLLKDTIPGLRPPRHYADLDF